MKVLPANQSWSLVDKGEQPEAVRLTIEAVRIMRATDEGRH
ncbi:hypothetical protein HMPREF0530_1933 [Lacticaseibacillus paracasei subsp. paracasei ATCC 25302 = DSM 5622 = JCM 8130]|nr:hypothetical protein HMPREF0530_1933 [Lacticaseibacillus paracasei subsp. paracasei ATCC 25302 = DSM 5622 = JCM 8130]EKQ20667.1 hypothetical protein LCAUW4_1807 [Lacticaseibacillus casei UW4]